MVHLRVARLVARSRRQEAAALFLPLCGGGGVLGIRQRLRPAIGGDERGEVGELLGLEREKLVARLRRLKRACRRLARSDQRRHLRAVGVDIADHGGLHTHRVLQAADRVLPTRLRIGDELCVRRRHRGGRVFLAEDLIDLLDVVGDVLRLGEKLLGALHRLLKLLQRGVRQAREIAGLIDKRLRIVLERVANV